MVSAPCPAGSPDKRERDRRIVLIATVAVTAAALSFVQANVRQTPSDFAQPLTAAQLLLSGVNPWRTIGPGHAINDWGFPLVYPMPTLVAAMPFLVLPALWADAIFIGLSAGLLAWVLTRATTHNPQLLVFASFAFLFAIDTVQWSLLLTAVALVPPLGFLLLCKPTVGLAFFAAYPSRQAFLGCAIFGLLTIAIWPWWVREWATVLPLAKHIMAPVTLPGGFLVLSALIKWRRPEARLLVALACVPHTPVLYEAVPLFLVVNHVWEGALLAALTPVVWVITRQTAGYTDFQTFNVMRGTWQLWLLYVPCLLMVLLRPNAGPASSAKATSPRAEPSRPGR